MLQLLRKISAYWWCQILGWAAYLSINLFFSFTFREEITSAYILRQLVVVITGLTLTHIMRWVIIKWDILSKSFEKQIGYFLLVTISFALMLAFLLNFAYIQFRLLDEQELKYSIARRFTAASVNAFFLFMLWNLIYFIYHYATRVRNQQIESLKTESLIRDLQLQTIKSHINPHFIFNALNSIRALIDENPTRARQAITELSNILRSSMLADKLETVSLEKELAIVKDYLALEEIRFEERLKVRFEIDEQTLDQQVPPMMLQTLVENAIKHGIGKQVLGGEICISSSMNQKNHRIMIVNTGQMNGSYNEDGFGISATRQRLQLMFGDKASFTLKNADRNHVEAIVDMPV
jgi:two-component system LytT family sensor kinase